MTDIPPEAEFQLKYGRNVSDRIAPELLEAIRAAMPKTIMYGGRECQLKLLGEITHREEDGWRFMFDIIDPHENFDHVEFSVYKTGWGRMA